MANKKYDREDLLIIFEIGKKNPGPHWTQCEELLEFISGKEHFGETPKLAFYLGQQNTGK